MYFTILTSILSAFIAEASLSEFVCPQANGQFANPLHCDGFYFCSQGNATLMICPQGLSYNPSISVCDWSHNVDCNSADYSRDAIEFKCPQMHGQFANPSDCNTFFLCSFGNVTLMKCPENLHYNPSSSICDWDFNVNC